MQDFFKASATTSRSSMFLSTQNLELGQGFLVIVLSETNDYSNIQWFCQIWHSALAQRGVL